MKSIIYIVLLCFISFTVFAQTKSADLSTKSRSAVKHYKKGLIFLDKGQWASAKKELLSAIKSDANFIEAYLALGQTYEYMLEPEFAKQQYYKAIKINADFFPNIYVLLGKLELTTGNYEMAKENFSYYLQKFEKKSFKLDSDCEYGLKVCTFAINAMKNPVPFEPVNLGMNINTENAEYLPSLTADEQLLIFTVRLPLNSSSTNVFLKYQEDFFISFKKDNKWMKSSNIGSPINTNGNEGAQCISPNGQYIYFTACDRRGSVGGCDIYISRFEGDQWGKPFNLGEAINSPAWETQPSISADGKTLYFVSNRKGGLGGPDIWMSEMQPEGNWGKPINMGSTINTKNEEQSPFIHPDNQTLYFSSNGHIGMGGYDLLISRKDLSVGKWLPSNNLGYPINTHNDEKDLIVSTNGKTAYFASNKKDGFGELDLYSFELYPAVQPQKVSYVKGVVFDKVNKGNLFARFEFIDLETGFQLVESFSNKKTGEFLVCLPANKNYALNVSKENYLFYSETFQLKQRSFNEAYFMDVFLQPIQLGEKVVLKNIFFEIASYILKDESKVELEKLIAFLNTNPQIKIEVSGHTDNIGDDKYNLTLSENRAKSVIDYLISRGISFERLTYKGYGKDQPITSNETEEGRAQNRRTEFKIMEK